MVVAVNGVNYQLLLVQVEGSQIILYPAIKYLSYLIFRYKESCA